VAGNTRKQVIKVVYDSAEAEQKAEARSTEEQKRIKDDARAAKDAAKEQAKYTSDLDREMAKIKKEAAAEAAQKVKDVNESLNENDKRRAEASKQLDKEMAKIRKEAAAEAAQKVKDVNESLNENDKRRAEASKQLDREMAKIKSEAAREAADKVKAFNRQLDEDDKRKAAALKKQQAAWEKQNESIVGAAKSVGMFVLGMAGLNSAASIMSKIVEHFNAVRLAGLASGDDLIKYAKSLQSLGALEGTIGEPEAEVVSQLKFRAKTLQTPEAAAEMKKQMMASAQGAIDSGIVKKEVMQTFGESQGQLQVMLNESPSAIGKVAGAMPMMLGYKDVKLEEMQAMSEKIRLLAKGGGFQSYE